MFRLRRDDCTSLSVASTLTRPFTILYIKTSLALCLLSLYNYTMHANGTFWSSTNLTFSSTH